MAALACPLPSCTIAAGAGARFGATAALGGKVHTGLDLIAAYGTPLRAPAAGVVKNIHYEVQGGRVLELTHSDRIETRYAHLSRIDVKQGQTVGAGQVLGATGASGLVTGPHLHFEVLLDGQYVDPAPYLGLGAGATLAMAPSSSAAAPPQTRQPNADGSCPAGYIKGSDVEKAYSDGFGQAPGPLGLVLGAAASFANWLPGGPDPNLCYNRAQVADAAYKAAAAVPQVDPVGAIVGTVVPVLANVGVVVLCLGLAYAGVRRILAA